MIFSYGCMINLAAIQLASSGWDRNLIIAHTGYLIGLFRLEAAQLVSKTIVALTDIFRQVEISVVQISTCRRCNLLA